MKKLTLLTLVGFCALPVDVYAKDIHAVGMVDNYTCMMLNVPKEKLMDFNNPPVFKLSPSDTAPDGMILTAQVAVKTAAPAVNGYVMAIQSDGKTAWVRQDQIVPFDMPEIPGEKCFVAKMSNGDIGFVHKPQ